MQAHLLIDGYNVILGLPHLEKIFQRDKERARDELGRIARNIHDADAVRVTIVFDGSGVDHEIVRPGKELTFSFLFSPASSTADNVIVDLLANARRSTAVTVVTKDQVIGPCGLGTRGHRHGPGGVSVLGRHQSQRGRGSGSPHEKRGRG